MKSKHEASEAMKRTGPAVAGDASADSPSIDLRDFFSASEGRVDRWRSLHRLAKGLAGSNGPQTDALRTGAADLLAAMEPIEDLCGFPGHRLMTQVHDRIRTGDWTGFVRLVQRISAALLSNSYRDDPEVWTPRWGYDDEGGSHYE